MRENEPDDERIACAGLIDEAGDARVPAVKTFVVRVVEDAAASPALEDDETEPAVDEAGKRLVGILEGAIDQQFIFAGKKRVSVSQGVPLDPS